MALNYNFIAKLIAIVFSALTLWSCSMSYSFTGADIPADARTFSVEYFQNNAPLADPDYPQQLTETLKDLMLQQSPLNNVRSDGDLMFSGSIDEFFIAPVNISGNETAQSNRLTISITVQYTNAFEESKNFEKRFSRFADFDNTQTYEALKDGLISTINEQLVQDIFNQSIGNW